MVPRAFRSRLRELLELFPFVCVLGPRQAGKTTFIQSELPRWRYLDLERPSDAAPFSEDPESGLDRLPRPFILDEAQRLPEIFPVLRGMADRARGKKGWGVLLGAASPRLVASISESLAGRVGFLELTPFQARELEIRGGALNRLWHRGGFPDAYLAPSDRAWLHWYEAFSRTFLESDLPALGIDISAVRMRRLMTMLAHLSGGLWNASTTGESLGVSYHTVNRYVDILEATFLVRRLPPYLPNIRKRLVKSPKVYLRDSGLIHYLFGIHDENALDAHPVRGASWEGFLVEQLVNLFALEVPGSEAFHWRTADGAEVDLLLRAHGRLVPIEIKLHSAPTKGMTRGLLSCLEVLQLHRGFILYPGRRDYSLGGGIEVLSAPKWLADPPGLTDRLLRAK